MQNWAYVVESSTVCVFKGNSGAQPSTSVGYWEIHSGRISSLLLSCAWPQKEWKCVPERSMVQQRHNGCSNHHIPSLGGILGGRVKICSVDHPALPLSLACYYPTSQYQEKIPILHTLRDDKFCFPLPSRTTLVLLPRAPLSHTCRQEERTDIFCWMMYTCS